MFDIGMLFPNGLFDSINGLFHLRCGKAAAKPQIECQHDAVRSKMHRQNIVDALNAGVGFGQAADVFYGFRIGTFTDQQTFGLIREQHGDDR